MFVSLIIIEIILQRCIECNGNGNNCMDVGSDGNGVSNADFILYVSAKTTGSCPTEASEGSGSPTTIAFASSCQMESALDRLYSTIKL